MPKIHSKFEINGYLAEEFIALTIADARLKKFQNEMKRFQNTTKFSFLTSGTTGKPKKIEFSIEQITSSVNATHQRFGLFIGAVVWHALPLEYVAGKMMLYRALLCGYRLVVTVPVLTNSEIEKLPLVIDFAPLVPLQVGKLVELGEFTTNRIKKVLIGGAPISDELERKLLEINSSGQFYESFGSTESLTHIAVRNISQSDEFFKALPGVQFFIENDCLVISAPTISEGKLRTNDIVDLKSATEFRWLGRANNVINSGGIKLFPEQIEKKLKGTISVPFFIASRPSIKLGEEIILVIQSDKKLELVNLHKLLDKFERPKEIFYNEVFVSTESGKINRKATLDSIQV